MTFAVGRLGGGFSHSGPSEVSTGDPNKRVVCLYVVVGALFDALITDQLNLLPSRPWVFVLLVASTAGLVGFFAYCTFNGGVALSRATGENGTSREYDLVL